MIVIAFIIMLFFCGALTFMIMTLLIGKANAQEEEKDPSQFLLGNVTYEANKEFIRDYATYVPAFMTMYGYDRKFPEDDEFADEDASLE